MSSPSNLAGAEEGDEAIAAPGGLPESIASRDRRRLQLRTRRTRWRRPWCPVATPAAARAPAAVLASSAREENGGGGARGGKNGSERGERGARGDVLIVHGGLDDKAAGELLVRRPSVAWAP